MKPISFNTLKMTFSATQQRSFYSAKLPQCSQVVPEFRPIGEEFVTKLLDRKWALLRPDSRIEQFVLGPKGVVTRRGEMIRDFTPFNDHDLVLSSLSCENVESGNREPSFYIVRDDLLHPLVNGNKSRKLDALLPMVEDHSVTDIVTCGGCQSAHTAAVAVSCAERGIKSHLLLRGEQPEILTGYNLISTMYGNVNYVPRSAYSDRENMLRNHADFVAGNSGKVLWFDGILEESLNENKFGEHPRKVVIVNEGAGDVVALLGLIRLVQYLSQDHLFGKERRLKLVVDTGTGTTAVGLGLGVLCLGLPWEITAVMLADTVTRYRQHEKHLISKFKLQFGFPSIECESNGTDDSVVNWVERRRPRKFGNILEGEIEACQEIARKTGILVDPVYTLAAWETATMLCENEDAKVVMVHSGGTLGMFGLAQRYKSYFSKLKDTCVNK